MTSPRRSTPALAQTAPVATPPAPGAGAHKPALFLIGDSTIRNGYMGVNLNGSSNGVLTANNVLLQDSFGIRITGTNNTLTSNAVYKNTDNGIEAGAGSVMSAFNEIGGVPTTVNQLALRTILRDEWQWPGLVLSDYEAVNGVMFPKTIRETEIATGKELNTWTSTSIVVNQQFDRSYFSAVLVLQNIILMRKHLHGFLIGQKVFKMILDERSNALFGIRNSL